MSIRLLSIQSDITIRFTNAFERPFFRQVVNLGDLYAESGQTSQGSFSAVSKPNFASKYALESSRRDLHNALLCTVLESNPKNQENHGGKRTWSNPGKTGQEKVISSRNSLPSTTSARDLKKGSFAPFSKVFLNRKIYEILTF